MNRKGFTLLELLILGAIIGMFAALIIPAFMDDAHGMEIQKLLPADDATVIEVTRLLKQDSHLIVTVVTYSSNWTMDTVDPLLDQAREVLDTLHKAGIYANRVTMLFANGGGLSEDPMPTPTADGVYLYLEYEVSMIGQFKGQYDWASNFYMGALFHVHHQPFKSSEHYFAASKTLDAGWCGRIMEAAKPAEAKKLGQKCPIRPEWNNVRVPVMADALWYKFSQNVVIQQKLVDTEFQLMVEGNWWHDNFWGDCHCNNKSGKHSECLKPGLNKLGLLLMNLRRYFQDVQMISI